MLLNAYFERKEIAAGARFTVKSAVTLAIVALAIALPQIVHAAAGAAGGMQWLPMYLPVLLGGCILGVRWGVCAGLLAPVVSFLITSAAGNAMPAATRLPYMMAELAVFAAVSGAFSSLIVKNAWAAFPAVLLAGIAGRLSFLTLAAVFQSVSPLSAATAWAQIETGLVGLLLQAALVPAVVILLRALLLREKERGEE